MTSFYLKKAKWSHTRLMSVGLAAHLGLLAVINPTLGCHCKSQVQCPTNSATVFYLIPEFFVVVMSSSSSTFHWNVV